MNKKKNLIIVISIFCILFLSVVYCFSYGSNSTNPNISPILDVPKESNTDNSILEETLPHEDKILPEIIEPEVKEETNTEQPKIEIKAPIENPSKEDTTKPVKKVNIKVSQDLQKLTNQDITFTIETLDTDLISFNNSMFSTNKIYKVSENGNYSIKIKDNNVISSSNITVNNIDKEKPTLNISKNTEAANVGSVTITLSSTDNRELPNKRYSYDNGSFVDSNTYTFKTNVDNFSVRVIDSAGNVTEELIEITNINPDPLYVTNNAIVQEIKDTYGFDVDYGQDTFFWFGGESSTLLTDENHANEALKKLKNALKQFPNDFFEIFQGKNGYSVLLVEDIPGEVEGVATREMPGSNQLIVDINADFFSRVFYHETMHMIDYLLDYMYYGRDDHPFKNWRNLNNSSFSYEGDSDLDDTLTVLDDTIDNSEKRFITAYSKVSEREDRAELFADLMFRAYKHDYMSDIYGIYHKAVFLVNVLNSIWTNNTNAGWNRWI